MEDLTKQQLVLLTVLVSFVCSVATSITIVSILTDSTPVISQNFNRIVEKTIERVVTGTTTPTVIKVPTSNPVLTENEQMVASIQSNLAFMASISSPKTETNEGEKRGIGFIADAGGLVATDKSVVGEWNELSVALLNGKTYTAKKVFVDEKTGVALLELYDDKGKVVMLRGASLSAIEPKLGQAILSLGGKGMSTVSEGIVSEVTKSSDPENPITRLITSLSFTLADRGGPLFGIDGKVIGINMLSEGKSFSLSSTHIIGAINDFKTPKTDKSAVVPATSQMATPAVVPGV